jgi:Fe-S-cluster-containing hydrogenase component 2
VGDARRQVPDQLERCAFRCVVPWIRHRRLQSGGQRHRCLRCGSCVRLVECTTVPIHDATASRGFAICATDSPLLRLLHRSESVSHRPQRMSPQLVWYCLDKVLKSSVESAAAPAPAQEIIRTQASRDQFSRN